MCPEELYGSFIIAPAVNRAGAGQPVAGPFGAAPHQNEGSDHVGRIYTLPAAIPRSGGARNRYHSSHAAPDLEMINIQKPIRNKLFVILLRLVTGCHWT